MSKKHHQVPSMCGFPTMYSPFSFTQSNGHQTRKQDPKSRAKVSHTQSKAPARCLSRHSNLIVIASIQEVQVPKIVGLQILIEAHRMIWFRLEWAGEAASWGSLVRSQLQRRARILGKGGNVIRVTSLSFRARNPTENTRSTRISFA